MRSEPVTVLILAKPSARIAQLELLLRSLDRYWPGQNIRVLDAPAGPAFETQVREQLAEAGDFVCFLTDDGVFYRDVTNPTRTLEQRPDVLCHSLRLGANASWCYPLNRPHRRRRSGVWLWWDEDGDFGYPGSVDAHVFRRTDLLRMLYGRSYPNPTSLEVVLDHSCRRHFQAARPCMTAPTQSCYVSVPVNRVSEQSGVRYGQRFPQSAGELNLRFLAGERIRLDSIRPEHVNAAHVEFRFLWEPQPRSLQELATALEEG